MAKDKEYYKQFLTNANAVAYLNAISSIEAPTYFTANGGQTYVPTSAAHPDTVFAGGTTEAFGRYQFMFNTWKEINAAIGPLDIREPRDQDIAALYLLDEKRGTLENVVAGNCIATLNSNSYEWAALPTADSTFRYGGQRGKYDAKGFCDLVNSLKGTTLPTGPLVSNAAPNLQSSNSSTAPPSSNFGATNFSDINCPPIKEEDMYRANFQITNPGCKVSGAIQPITGSNTNGSTVRSSNLTNSGTGFSVNAQGKAQCTSLRNPTKAGDAVFTSPFGYRIHPITGVQKSHQGVDLAAPTGTPIYAASNGTVDYAQWDDSGYGNRIEIVSPEGIRTTYNHLEIIKCSVGQQITVGQQIGDMGSTGRSTGSHLHFEVYLNAAVNGSLGNLIDPEDCLTLR